MVRDTPTEVEGENSRNSTVEGQNSRTSIAETTAGTKSTAGATGSNDSGKDDSVTEVRPFQVLSFNAFIRPPIAGMSALRYEWQDQRLTIFSKEYLPKFDLILMQEGFQSLNYRMERWVKRWEKYFNLNVVLSKPHSLWGVLTRWERVGDAGLIIMTKHRVAAQECYEFQCEAHSACMFAGKGVLYALVYPEGSKQGIHVFNTHLQATYEYKDFDRVSEIRAEQAKEIVQFMKEKVHNNPDPELRNFPVLLGGDFNENARPKNDLCHRPDESDANSTPEYVRLIRTLTTFTGKPPVDLLLESAKRRGETEHPVTFADTIGPDQDDVCTEMHFYEDKYVLNSRLDYTFVWPGASESEDAVYDFDPTKIESSVWEESAKMIFWFQMRQVIDKFLIIQIVNFQFCSR